MSPELLRELAATSGAVRPIPGQVGRYRIERLLGKGGMGSVYLAFDPQMDRRVALKIPHFGAEQPETLERFYREARTAGRLQHPNICPVFDAGEAAGVHYLSMAYIDGVALSTQVKEFSRKPPRETASLVRTLALALEEAHQQGIIHRDLKPANIMMNRRGEPIVMDFGLAHVAATASAVQTQPGTIFGTPAYMAPEQAQGDIAALGPGCDIYSLGVVLYELLTGKVPFEGTLMEVLDRQVHDEPARPTQRRTDLDAHIEAICLKALAKEPSRRFLSMMEFAQALADYLGGVPAEQSSRLALQETDPIEAAAAEALVQLRTWGWLAGVHKLRARLEGQPGPGQLLLRWLRGEEQSRAEAIGQFRPSRQFSALAGWALVGEAYQHNRDHDFARADCLLREAADQGDPRDNVLQASIAHQKGFFLFHAWRPSEAVTALHEALALCGREHFLTGPILDTLGLVYASKNNFLAAREFFVQAIDCKRRFGDDGAIARSLRQLGHLYLEWGDLDRAEEVLQRGLEMSLDVQDERGRASSFRYLGRVTLARAERAEETGQQAVVRRELVRASEWLDAAIKVYQGSGRLVREAITRRHRALLCLLEQDIEQAQRHGQRAQECYTEVKDADGLARLWKLQGILARRQGDFATAERLLRQALAHFDHIGDGLEGTRTQREIARTLAGAGAISGLVSSAYLNALKRAEACRRTHLVRAIEEELKGVDDQTYWRHAFERVRGRLADSSTASLTDGTSEVATALFLNLRGFIPFCQGLTAEEVMHTLNQMMADLSEVLERYQAQVTAYLGGGFMALVRGTGHAVRGVNAALDLIGVVEEFNRPRSVLGLGQLPVRVSVASGAMFLGNIGTYHKMDFTAVGNAVNLASCLLRRAEGNWPCISRETRDLVVGRFSFSKDSPRSLELPGFGRLEVWDVIGRKQGLMSHQGL
jgi:class 3 adenylate cyclase/tetratricopeptide (TPR) repeat protein/predicted Ser/Thr protein kinase